MSSSHQRIGIFRGTFDPIHAGHIAFATEAIKAAGLDHVYFLVESDPLHKTPVTDYQQRSALVAKTVEPYELLDVLDLGIPNQKASQIIPKLKTKFGSSILVFLMGSDIAKTLPVWSDLKVLCDGNEIVIALRGKDSKENIMRIVDALPVKPDRVTVISAPLPDVSSSVVRKE